MGQRAGPRHGADSCPRSLPACRAGVRSRIPACRWARPAGLRPTRGRGEGPHRGSGPLPEPGPRGRAGVLGSAEGAPAAPQPSEHLPGARGRCRRPPTQERRPFPMGRPRRAAAQQGADRPTRGQRQSSRQGLGNRDRTGDLGPVRQGRPSGGHLVGTRCAVRGALAGGCPMHQEPAPVAVVRPHWILRIPTFQPCQRPAGPAGRRPHRLEPAVNDEACAPAAPSQDHEPAPFTRYVAIGDSFTEGLADADPGRPDAYIGWADRLAAHLARMAGDGEPAFGYANLAVRGRLLSDIAGRQVDSALALAPDLVSIVGGGNDILRPKADIDALADRLEDAVARLRASGADVLLAPPTDPREAPLLKASRARSATYTAHIWSIAQRHGAHV